MTNNLIPYSFVPGTKAKASEVNANFIALADGIATNSTQVATKLNKDFSNITSAGLDFLKENTAPARNIGEIVSSTLPLTDAGLHLLDGSLIYNSGIYSDFVDYISGLDHTANYFCTEADWQTSVSTYGVCGKFVYDSVNNTVRLPKITGKLDGTTDITALGELAEQYIKLPNITGSFNYKFRAGNSMVATGSGAFSTSGTSKAEASGSGGSASVSNALNISFNASRSSSIYSGDGTDTQIHEQAIKCYYYIVIATSAKTDVQVDIDEIATDLNGKADNDLTNVTDSAKVVMSGIGMPGDQYIDLTLGASGTEYTAPANGWFYLYSSSVANTILFVDDECGYGSTVVGASGYVNKNLLPVKKNTVVQITYSTASGTGIRFIYAQGSESDFV